MKKPKTKKVYGYICSTAVTDIHLGAKDVIMYPSIKALKKERECWKECGILRIDLTELQIVVKGTL